ncbi:DNA polymerase domain-containing protein [Leptospira ellisii]|uniref:DNA-directed DNA polymerase n=2 Tax=Leptospira ellisii TaxID=2023197 RepID=A0AAE4TXY2_9LEPT|nr:DNA polymerase domain-containing protein [Leptospira ellisii]MDV6234531.1 DNA polymerase domain-containing protein [Leptospira ellisii]
MSNLGIVKGSLFDIYHIEDKIHLWIKDEDGNARLFYDFHQPIVYARGNESVLKKLVHRFYQLDALAEIPVYKDKKLFYENEKVQVLQLTISRPSVLSQVSRKLYALYGKFDIYHSDIEVPTSYMVSKGLFPLCELKLSYSEEKFGRQVRGIEILNRVRDMEYSVPKLKTMYMSLSQSHRIDMKHNSIVFRCGEKLSEFSGKNPKELLQGIDSLFKLEDPDIVLSTFGDHTIFPYLFSQSQKLKIFPAFDRDRTIPIRRHIQTKGTSYNTYGTIVYRAPSYPLFGRWHIDSQNSFVHREADLLGIIELARLSRLPIQKMSRASTGKALTSIEVDVALKKGYLVPWQKSAVESPKTALQLLEADKGGLVFQPDVSDGTVFENVAQLDFAQMYPTIMVNHNISPECVNCVCCEKNPKARIVPGLGYRICVRRRGIVSQALKHVLERREYYKIGIKERKENAKVGEYEQKQNSLKWMLVTSFGYLGYRNAKFGRLESHESVNAFAREKLLTAKESAEKRGYAFVHAITDSIFIRKTDSSPFSREELDSLCEEIKSKTGIRIDVDGVYTWLQFPSSSQDPKMPVANRYMGRFESGKLKCRGIGSRRKDLPAFVKTAQNEMLEWMRGKVGVDGLKNSENEILEIYNKYDLRLKNGSVDIEDLLIRRSTSKTLEEYEVNGASSLSLLRLKELGIDVQAGEKIRYLVLNRKGKRKDRWYLPEEALQMMKKKGSNSAKTAVAPKKSETASSDVHWDRVYYRKLLVSLFREIWSPLASFSDFESLLDDQRWLPFGGEFTGTLRSYYQSERVHIEP